MFWDKDDDSESTQRLKNLLFLKMSVTNKKRDESMPILGCVLVIVILVVAVIAGLTHVR